MAKWEYAAIVGKQRTGWMLAKPAASQVQQLTLHQGPSKPSNVGISWQVDAHTIHEWEAAVVRNNARETHGNSPEDWKLTGVPEILFESNDILVLINMAGADGWEITGGIGYGDSEPRRHETRWRIMRREL
jgi:hypothetical protein